VCIALSIVFTRAQYRSTIFTDGTSFVGAVRTRTPDCVSLDKFMTSASRLGRLNKRLTLSRVYAHRCAVRPDARAAGAGSAGAPGVVAAGRVCGAAEETGAPVDDAALGAAAAGGTAAASG
jgi:hypothetical protein